MSLGSALFEEMVFDNGQPINCDVFRVHAAVDGRIIAQKFQDRCSCRRPQSPDETVWGEARVGKAALGPVGATSVGSNVPGSLSIARPSKTSRSGRIEF